MTGELRAQLISGGRSNLTFLVADDSSKWVLRRPPLHGLTPSAHDMAREYKVVAALADTAVPVARAVALCDDESVLGAPFQMVEYVAGQVVRSRANSRRRAMSRSSKAASTRLSRCWRICMRRPGRRGTRRFRQTERVSGMPGPPLGFRSGNSCGPSDDDRDPDVQRLYSALQQSIPQQSRTSIVDGDYRIDNTILDADDPRQVRAVVDWELSTLGDPLSDAALMCVYRDPSLDLIINTHAA